MCLFAERGYSSQFRGVFGARKWKTHVSCSDKAQLCVGLAQIQQIAKSFRLGLQSNNTATAIIQTSAESRTKAVTETTTKITATTTTQHEYNYNPTSITRTIQNTHTHIKKKPQQHAPTAK